MIGKDGQEARVTTILRPLAAKVNSRAGVNALRGTMHRYLQELGIQFGISYSKQLLNQTCRQSPKWTK